MEEEEERRRRELRVLPSGERIESQPLLVLPR